MRRKRGRKPGPDGCLVLQMDLFRLARELVSDGVTDLDAVRRRLTASCDRLGVDPTDAYTRLLDAWDGVDLDAHPLAFSSATVAVDGGPIPFVDLPKHIHNERNYQRVAALAYWLGYFAQSNRREWFPFPCRPVADWLDIHRVTVGSIIRRLDKEKVILLRRDRSGDVMWHSEAGYSREAKYLGPKPYDDGIKF